MKPILIILGILMSHFVRAQNQTIVEIAAGNDNFSLLVSALETADLVDTLNGTGPFTVFAPVNSAFLQSAQDLGYTGENGQQALGLLAGLFPVNQIQLADLLTYHVAAGSLNSSMVLNMTQITTLSDSRTVQVNANGLSLGDEANQIDDAGLIAGTIDIQASNGIIHAIDRVLWPFAPDTDVLADASPEPTPSVGPTTSPTPAEDDDDPICFPASAVVHTANGGNVAIESLSAGDTVHVAEGGEVSDVYLFSHKTSGGLHQFIRIKSDKGHALTISGKHYLYANGFLTAADAVRVGDVLRTLDGLAQVTSVEKVMERGLFAPHTMHGDIVVDRVVASTYTAAVHPYLAHMLLAPIRAIVRAGLSKEPLGSVLYHGASNVARMTPGGSSSLGHFSAVQGIVSS